MNSATITTPEVSNENQHSFNSMLLNSVSQAKRHLQEGLTSIKDEFLGICDKAETYFNIIALPVNNFLKDHSQIEAELEMEINKEGFPFQSAGRTSNIVPIEQAMNGRMEENY